MKIKFNVTTSYNWSGAPVGIIRTEIEILKALKKTPGLQISLFVIENGSCYPLTFEDYEKGNSDKGSKPVTQSPRQEEFIVPLVSRKEALKRLAQASLSLSPRPIRPVMNLAANTCAKLLKKIIRYKRNYQVKRMLPGKPVQHTSNIKKTIGFENSNLFEDGDVIITCGLDWELLDLFENLYFLKKDKQVKVVSFCYDLIPVYFPQYCTWNTVCSFSSYFLDLIEASDLICCISKSTEKDLHRFISETGAKEVTTSVLYLGADIKRNSRGCSYEASKINVRLDVPYLLYVSTIERRKNHEVLYKAYRKLIEDGYGDVLPDLYFVGMEGWGVHDFLRDLSLDPLIGDKIRILGRLDDAQLEQLYENSLFVLFPSLYEGWGLGVAESLSFGKFVLSSDRGSLPEVGRNLVDYVDPLRPDLWAEKILFYSTDKEALRNKEDEIKKMWAPYTWEATAKKLLNDLKDLDIKSQSK